MIPLLSNLKLTEDGKWSITIHTKAYTCLVKKIFTDSKFSTNESKS